MNAKDLTKADSETFWKYMLKTIPKDDKPVYIASDAVKAVVSPKKNKR